MVRTTHHILVSSMILKLCTTVLSYKHSVLVLVQTSLPLFPGCGISYGLQPTCWFISIIISGDICVYITYAAGACYLQVAGSILERKTQQELLEELLDDVLESGNTMLRFGWGWGVYKYNFFFIIKYRQILLQNMHGLRCTCI